MSPSESTSATLECIPCLCRETVAAVRSATPDAALQDAILGEALFHLAMRDPALPASALAEDIRRLIAARLGTTAPGFNPARHCPRGSA